MPSISSVPVMNHDTVESTSEALHVFATDWPALYSLDCDMEI
jgi:hypothetical protein